MAEPECRHLVLSVDFHHGGVLGGAGKRGRVFLYSKQNKKQLKDYVREQLDHQNIVLTENLAVTLIDIDKELPPVVGYLHWDEATGWYADFDFE